MKPIKEIAQAFGLSPNSVKKWTPAKRERASTLIDMQINPVIMQLVGELHALCFATSNMSNKLLCSTYTENGLGHLGVMILDSEPVYLVELQPLTVENLKAAIEKVEEIVYA